MCDWGGGVCARQSVDQQLELGCEPQGLTCPGASNRGDLGSRAAGVGSYWIDWVSKSSYWRNPHCIYICIWMYIFYLRSFILISWSREQDDTVGGGCICVFRSLLIYVAGHMYMHMCCIMSVSVAVYVPVGNTCSALLPTGPGNMKLQQLPLCWVTGLGTPQQNSVEEQM